MFKKSFNLIQSSLKGFGKQPVYRYISTNAYKNIQLNKVSQKSLQYNGSRFFSSNSILIISYS